MRVAVQGPWRYLSVCPWLECRGESWLETVFTDGYIQVILHVKERRKHELNCWQLPCWRELCGNGGNGWESLYPQQRYFYGDHVTGCN